MAGHNNVRHSDRSHDSRGASRRKAAAGGSAAPPAHKSGFELLESRLLMSAVRPADEFALLDLGRGDDRSTTSAVGIGFDVNFFGVGYSGLFVNNNGNVSLGARNSFYVNADMDAIASRMIAPFYANVDTRSSGSTVKYGQGTADGRIAFAVNWVDVDYYLSTAGRTNQNSFQLVLIDRSDLGYGDFDLEFNYDRILWETGTSSGGDSAGLGGSSARIGWTAFDGDINSIFQMEGSNVPGSFLDSNTFTGLVHNSFMSDVDGRYVFRFRGGTWADAPGSGGETNHDPILTLPEGREIEESADGTASIGGLYGFFDDPDADTWFATVDYGDGSGGQVLELSDHGFVLDHTYTQPGLYTVTVTVMDDKGGVGTAMTAFAVQDRTAPVVDVLAPSLVREGETVSLVASLANDLDANDTYTFDWNADGVLDGDTFSFGADDNGAYSVRLVVSDQHGNTTTLDVPVNVENVAPTATLSGADGLDEGGTLTLSLDGGHDASSADLASGLLYGFDFDGDGLFEVTGASPCATHLYDDNGLHLVRARVSDKDGGHSDYEMLVEVRNVAPTAAGLFGPASGDEGSALTFSLGAATDPSAADAAGLTYSFDFDDDGTWDVVGASASATHTYDDNGRYTIRARVSDKDGGHSDYTTEVHVRNVPPRNGHFTDNNHVAEGSPVTVSFGGQEDPSGADTAAGFTYSFDFDGDGAYEVSGTSPSASHVFGDNGVYTVRGRVTDKDGGATEYTTDVVVDNVAPTAAGLSGGSTVEGSSVTLTVNGASDVAADVAAGLTYSFDLDNDGVFDVVGSSPSVSHAFAQDGTYTVRARVSDKDGGFSDHAATVTVANAAPVIHSVSNSAATLGAARTGSTVTVSGSFGDAGLLDTHTAFIDWGDGSTSLATLGGSGGAYTLTGSHVYAQGGVYTVRVRLSDDASPMGMTAADSTAYVTGLGLHNGVLHIVGTNGNDSVSVSTDHKGQIKVRSSMEKRDSLFASSSVNEIRATLGDGDDGFSADADTVQPMYVNGVRYFPPVKGKGGTTLRLTGITSTVFSDRLVA